MSDYEQVMALTRTVSSETAFQEAECRALWELAEALPPHSTIVEIGCQFGRSTSILAQVAKEKNHHLICIDPFTDPPDAAPAWISLMKRIGCPVTLHCMKTEQLSPGWMADFIHLALVDGDHWVAGVRTDCAILLPHMSVSSHITFHDYGRDSLPDVYPTVNAAMVGEIFSGKPWEELPTVGTLGIWRRK